MPSRPIPVRLKEDVIRRLDAVADAASLDRSDVIKLCLKRFLDELDAKPEMLLRDWSGILKTLDGRTFRYTPEETPPPAGKKVDYKKALAADKKRARTKAS